MASGAERVGVGVGGAGLLGVGQVALGLDAGHGQQHLVVVDRVLVRFHQRVQVAFRTHRQTWNKTSKAARCSAEDLQHGQVGRRRTVVVVVEQQVVLRRQRVVGLVGFVAMETGRVGDLAAGHFGDVGQRVLALVGPVRTVPVVAWKQKKKENNHSFNIVVERCVFPVWIR